MENVNSNSNTNSNSNSTAAKSSITNILKNDNLMLRITMYLGMMLRIFYVAASPVIQSRQYDLGSVSPAENIYTGHLGYIYYLNTFKHFTEFDPREVYQFFHPPLHHIIEALWMVPIKLFTDSQDIINEWLQIPTCIYSVLILVTVFYLLKELKIEGKGAIVTMAVVAFQPSLIFMAGSLNNDGLSFLFMFLILYMSVKWFRTRTTKDILFLAVFIGCGMITKLSVGMLAVPVAFLYLYVFICEWKEKNSFPVNRFMQYIIFGIVCVPLGMCWAVRCLIRFNMPLNYVNHLPEDSWQYVGNYSLMERFFLPNPVTLLNNLKNGGIGLGENMWVQLFRTAALGECDLGDFPFAGKIIMMLLLLTAFLVAFICFYFFIRVFVCATKSTYPEKEYPALRLPIRLFMIFSYVILVVFFVNFCYNYPHQCTMNFRYIVPTVLMPSMALGIAINKKERAGWINAICILVACYCVLSVISIFFWAFCYR